MKINGYMNVILDLLFYILFLLLYSYSFVKEKKNRALVLDDVMILPPKLM